MTRCRATPHPSASPPPSPQRGRLTVGFCFSDRDFATSPPITSFSFSEKEKEGKRKHTQGTAPRGEPRFAPADRDEIKIRGSMRLRPPRPPENGQAGRAKQQRCCAQRRKFLYSGQKTFVSCPRGMIPTLASPRGLRSRGAVLNWFPVGTNARSSACGTATDTSRSETAPPAGGDEV